MKASFQHFPSTDEICFLDKTGKITLQKGRSIALRFKKRTSCSTKTTTSISLEAFFRMDFLLPNERGNIVIECKAVENLGDRKRSQLFSYLVGTQYPIGILVNFSSYPKLQLEKYYFDRRDKNFYSFRFLMNGAERNVFCTERSGVFLINLYITDKKT